MDTHQWKWGLHKACGSRLLVQGIEGRREGRETKSESFGKWGILVFRLMCAYDTSSIEWVDGWYPAEGLYNSPFFYASIIDWEFVDSSSDLLFGAFAQRTIAT